MFNLFKRRKKKQDEVKEVQKAIPTEDTVTKEEEVNEAPVERVEVNEDKPVTPKKRKAVMHITKHKDGGWQVKKEGAQRALSKFDTQKEAIEYAKEIEKEKGTGYIIHKADGKARKKRY